MPTASSSDTDDALISNRLLFRITAGIGVLAALVAILSIMGKSLGEEMALGGNTTSAEIQHVIVGQDVLALPANVIRFENQRRSGRTEAISIYLAWPTLTGYQEDNATAFSDPSRMDALIFADFSQSVMSRDMSGRVEPIYSKLFAGAPSAGPGGLTVHGLSVKSGFSDEKLMTAMRPDGTVYAVRCVIPASASLATSADCQRDVHVGKDLTMLYRFSSRLLPQWEKIDNAMTTFAASHIQK